MTPQDFIAKWKRANLSERAAAQEHFLDLCDVLGQPTPAAEDPEGTHYTFERGVRKIGGGNGWADVWMQGHFGWEYKKIGFDNAGESSRTLNREPVARINPDLTANTDVTTAIKLASNLEIAFMGTTKGGAFDIREELAVNCLKSPNPNGSPNSDVVVPWVNGKDLTDRLRGMWIIDFGATMSDEVAAGYEAPFEYVRSTVKPERDNNARESYRAYWWRHVEARPAMRAALASPVRFLCTTRVSKHRLFVWLAEPTLPDSATFAFARDDDYFFGTLHSRVHEIWARAQGTQVRERESGFRYTPTTCFETFPFPEPTDTQREAIGAAAAELDRLRTNWLNPPEWTREEILEFPGSAAGPWRRYVQNPDSRGIVTVRYPRLAAKDAEVAKQLAKRTLTNLYNQRPTWLDLAHRKLDETVFAAYGWPADLTDDQILEKLLALNLERASG